jgi:biopolymer transport protein ExbB/biopolymer transport protein TolQ
MLAQRLLVLAQVGDVYVLYFLMALSVISIGIALDRAIYFLRRRVDIGALGRQLTKLLQGGDVDGARTLMQRTPGVAAAVVGDALAWYEKGPDAVSEVLQASLRERRPEAELGMLYLGTLGNNAPFIGLFGTVLGIVTAFRELGAANQGAMANVMASIGSALIATAVGILVALPAVVAFNLVQQKVAAIEDQAGTLGNLILAHLKSKSPIGGV